MKNSSHYIAVSLLCALVSGCALPVIESDQDNAKDCAKNFTVTGSSLSPTGKEYKTQVVIPGVSKNEAMQRASKKLAQDGLHVGTIEKEAGFLTASNKAIGGRGSQDDGSFYMSFDQSRAGITVSMRFKTGFGQVASDENMKYNFCSVLDAISVTDSSAPKEASPKPKDTVTRRTSSQGSKSSAPISAPVLSATKEKPTSKKTDAAVPNFKDFSGAK